MKSSFNTRGSKLGCKFGMGTLVVLAGAGFLGLSAGAAEAQTARAQSCVQTCLGRNLAMATCQIYCNRRFGATPTGSARAYGYTTPGRGGSCGEFRYLKGGKCVDARVDPPKLN